MSFLLTLLHSVQTVTSIWTASQNKRLEKDKVKRGVEPGLDRGTTLTLSMNDKEVEIHPFISHSDLVIKCHSKRLHLPDANSDGSATDTASRKSPQENTSRHSAGHPDGDGTINEHALLRDRQEEIDLLDDLIDQVLDMERRARRLLINNLDHGSKPRLLLQADKNLMDRAQDLLGSKRGDTGIGKARELNEGLTDLEEIR